MPDVFLSYSSKDRQAAQRVQEALAARGIDVFWDQETPAGQDWDTWIRGKLNACKVAVVLWSRASVKSDNVRHEALVARKAEKLLPAMIDAISTEDLPMGLYMVQTVNLTDWRDANSKGVAKLVEEIAARVGKRAAPAAAASAPAAKAAGGMSPKAQTTVALIGIAAVVAGVAWFMMQGQTPTLTSDRISGNQVFTPGDGAAATAPGATCLDGSVPTLGFCANGQGPIPPAPTLGGGESAFSAQLLGRWRWSDQQPCAAGPNVSMENGRLVFTTPDSRFVHAIETDGLKETHTRVLEPDFALGQEYRFTMSGSAGQTFLLVVNQSADTTDSWFRCE